MKIKAFRSTSDHRPKIILANGSERGDYVPLRHVHEKLGVLHDGVQLMKTYYPHDPCWSATQKISEVTRKKNVSYAWDYEYEDYHPLDIFCAESVTHKQLTEIKSFGADVHLTLTLDIGLSDSEIRGIVQKLAQYGRMFIRINHEVNGNWFRYNKQHHPKEVGDFFVRFHEIMKSESSQLFSVFNVSADVFMEHRKVKSDLLRLSGEQCGNALHAADFWSIDKYVSLHYAWPFQQSISETNSGYFSGPVEEWWRIVEETYLQMIWHNHGQAKKLFISEFNSDSDVDGLSGQAKIIEEVYSRISSSDYQWLEGIVMYQFRDYGGLGLQKGNLAACTDNPSLPAYQSAIKKFRNVVTVDENAWKHDEFTFAWPSANEKRGWIIEDIVPGATIVNVFASPVFIKKLDVSPEGHCDDALSGNDWELLDLDASMELGSATALALALPPHVLASGEIRPNYTIFQIQECLQKMIPSAEKS
jgi:hypothetical protein